MASAWGDSWGSAWGSSWGATQAATVATGGGGYLPRVRTKDDIRLERERLGILPKRAAEIIRAVAKEARNDELALYDAALEQRLKDAIYEAQLAYRNWYVDVLRNELRQREEDEEIVLLLI